MNVVHNVNIVPLIIGTSHKLDFKYLIPLLTVEHNHLQFK